MDKEESICLRENERETYVGEKEEDREKEKHKKRKVR
jgi:hypothetical protein